MLAECSILLAFTVSAHFTAHLCMRHHDQRVTHLFRHFQHKLQSNDFQQTYSTSTPPLSHRSRRDIHWATASTKRSFDLANIEDPEKYLTTESFDFGVEIYTAIWLKLSKRHLSKVRYGSARSTTTGKGDIQALLETFAEACQYGKFAPQQTPG